MNALFLWNGHPFTSLLHLPKYPEAQELPTAQLEQNIAMFRWITQRGRSPWHLGAAGLLQHSSVAHLRART